MDNDGDSPPTFCFQPPIATRRRLLSPFLNPVALIIILPILAFLLIFFFLPPFLNHTSHILKPASVKKSWDSLNIFLVLFTILCGILSRKNDDVPPAADGDGGGDQVNRSVSSSQWGEYNDRDQKVYSSPVRESVINNSRLRRNSSSYPDLRQESLWDTGDNRFRFFDDFAVNLYSSSSAASGYLQLPVRRSEVQRDFFLYPPTLPRRVVERPERSNVRDAPIRSEIGRGNVLHQSQTTVSEYFDYRPRRSEAERELSVEKDIPVDTFQVHRYPQPPSTRQSLAPPPPPPPPEMHFHQRQEYQSVKRKERVKTVNVAELENLRAHPTPPPLPPPPPPPPPAVTVRRSRLKNKKLERQITDATKEIATAITILYNQSKRKKKHRTRNIYNATLSPLSAHSSPEQVVVPPPTPPPLPPPPFVFHNMFKNGTKQKRIHSIAVTSPPPQFQPPRPPPSPPPPSSIFNNLFKSGGKSKRSNSSTAPLRSPPPPPPSVSNNNFNSITKRHFPAEYPPPAPLPPLSPTIFTKCQSAESVQAYSNTPVVSPRLSRRKIQTPPPPIPPITEPPRRRPSNKGKPPLPTKSSNHYERDDYHEYFNSGSQSPLYPIPPPLPPFEMPEMKFKVRGDFVSIRSAQSSVCNTPDRNDADFSSHVESDGGEVVGPVFFPSPDVNAKADSFISRLKDEWRMEKVKAKDGPRPVIKPAVNILY